MYFNSTWQWFFEDPLHARTMWGLVCIQKHVLLHCRERVPCKSEEGNFIWRLRSIKIIHYLPLPLLHYSATHRSLPLPAYNQHSAGAWHTVGSQHAWRELMGSRKSDDGGACEVARRMCRTLIATTEREDTPVRRLVCGLGVQLVEPWDSCAGVSKWWPVGHPHLFVYQVSVAPFVHVGRSE